MEVRVILLVYILCSCVVTMEPHLETEKQLVIPTH